MEAIFDILWWVFKKFGGYIKFSLVGMVGVAINFGLLYALTDLVGLWYLLSAVIAILVANSSNYLMNHFWTFAKRKEGNPSLFRGWLKYVFAVGVTEVLYLGLLYLLTSVIGLHYMLSAFLALCLTTVLRYLASARWIWKERRVEGDGLSTLERLERGLEEW